MNLEDIRRQIVRHANSCYFTMVAVDDNGQPTAVPQLVLRTLEERQRHEAACERRELRQAMEKHHQEIKQRVQDPAADPAA